MRANLHTALKCRRFTSVNAPINVKVAGVGGGEGGAYGEDLTFFKKLLSNSLPLGKNVRSNITEIPHAGK